MGLDPIYRKLSIPLLVLISIPSILLIACFSRQDAPAQTSDQRPSGSTTSGATGPAAHPPPPCPKFGKPPEPPAHWKTGEHKVILSWTASAPADAKHAAADGYCVYRGERLDDRFLVRVNSRAFRGTSCTDNRVETHKTYYYKVKAISINQTTSDATDFATAPILDRKPNPAISPPPLCQESDH